MKSTQIATSAFLTVSFQSPRLVKSQYLWCLSAGPMKREDSRARLPLPFPQDAGRIDLGSVCAAGLEEAFASHLGAKRRTLFGCERLRPPRLRCSVSRFLGDETLDEICVMCLISVSRLQSGGRSFTCRSACEDGGCHAW